jgi:O-antigen ligase
VIWIFAAILWYGILTLRVPERWALTAFELALFTLAAVLIVRRRGDIRLHPIGLLLAAAALWGLVQIGFSRSVEVQHTLEAALHWIANCAAFSVALALTGDPQRRQRFLTAQLVFTLLVSVVAVIALFTVSALGPFAYRNQFATFVEPALGIAIAAAMWDRRRPFLWVMVAAALFASVVAAGSRTGTILCLAELIVLPVIAFARGWISGRSLIRVAALSVVAAATLVAVAGWETIWRRLQEPNPYALRADLFRSSVAMTADRPLLGFGLGTWSDAYPAYARFDDGTFVNQAHNDWAQWAVEGGLPFLLLIAAIPVLLARPALRTLWGLGLLTVFLHAFVDYPMQQRPALASYFFALAGVLAGRMEER